MKQETIGIIFNWDISTMHPLKRRKYSMTVQRDLFDLTGIPKLLSFYSYKSWQGQPLMF